MTSAERLEQLCAIRDRSLTEEEQRDVKRCQRVLNDCKRKKERYWSCEEHRKAMIQRGTEGKRKWRIRERQQWGSVSC